MPILIDYDEGIKRYQEFFILRYMFPVSLFYPLSVKFLVLSVFAIDGRYYYGATVAPILLVRFIYWVIFRS